MYTLEKMVSVNYDRNADIITLEAEPDVLAQSECVTNIDTGTAIFNVGECDDIRSIEILGAAYFFRMEKHHIETALKLPEIRYDAYDGGLYVMDIIFEDIGTLRAVWGNTKPHCNLVHGNTVIAKRR